MVSKVFSRPFGWLIVPGVVLLAGLMALAVLAALDLQDYSAARQAQVTTNCAQALTHYDAVVNRFYLIDVNGVHQKSVQEREACRLYNQVMADTSFSALSSDLVTLNQLIKAYPQSPLAQPAARLIHDILLKAPPAAYVDRNSCPLIAEMGERAGLDNLSLANAYMTCAYFYGNSGDFSTARAVLKYEADQYKTSAMGKSAIDSLLTLGKACDHVEDVVGILSDFNQGDRAASFRSSCAGKH